MDSLYEWDDRPGNACAISKSTDALLAAPHSHWRLCPGTGVSNQTAEVRHRGPNDPALFVSKIACLRAGCCGTATDMEGCIMHTPLSCTIEPRVSFFAPSG